MDQLGSHLDVLREKLCLVCIPAYVVPRILIQRLYNNVTGALQPPDLSHHMANATIKWLSRSLSLSSFRRVTSPEVDISGLIQGSNILCSSNCQHRPIKTAHFQGSFTPSFQNATHTILYIHGGGFVSGSTDGSARYLLQLSIELVKQDLRCDILSVDYSLAPENPYPAALREVSAALQYALALGKPIILIGDSAGGHICLSLLVHLKNTHSHVEDIKMPGSGIGGSIIACCLNSPWMDLRNTAPSYTANVAHDCLDRAVLNQWASSYVTLKGLEKYCSNFLRESSCSDVLPQQTLIMVGDLELFRDDILNFAASIVKDGYNGMELDLRAGKGHAWPSVDFAIKVPSGLVDGTERDMKRLEQGEALAGLRRQAEWICRIIG